MSSGDDGKTARSAQHIAGRDDHARDGTLAACAFSLDVDLDRPKSILDFNEISHAANVIGWV